MLETIGAANGNTTKEPGFLQAEEALVRKLMDSDLTCGQSLKESVLAKEFNITRPSAGASSNTSLIAATGSKTSRWATSSTGTNCAPASSRSRRGAWRCSRRSPRWRRWNITWRKAPGPNRKMTAKKRFPPT